jgi:hypothetical protein
MVKKSSKSETVTVRQCSNIRSKKHPDARCTLTASQGDFCARHSKNPTRYQEKYTLTESITYAQLKSITKIQKWWKLYSGLLRFHRQGPAANDPTITENQTDVYTLESTSLIPQLYRWSYADAKKHIWIFDVRSISMMRTEDTREKLSNPYTRDIIDAPPLKKFHDHCTWLRKRKYCLVHTADTTEMTPDQLWHQKILDVTMKYDVLGYHTCLNWFEELPVQKLALFYTELWELWYYRLQLNNTVKNQVVPNWNADPPLFKWRPHELRNRGDKKWWQKTVLELLDRFVSSAQLKEHKTLGALYGITGFAIVSPIVREHYPWLVEMD